MAYTNTVTFDNLSLHAFTLPADAITGRKITFRESAADANPVAYDVAAPNSSNGAFRKYPAETVEFNASAGASGWKAGDTPGYIQPTSGTITFQYIIE